MGFLFLLLQRKQSAELSDVGIFFLGWSASASARSSVVVTSVASLAKRSSFFGRSSRIAGLTGERFHVSTDMGAQ